MDNFYNLKPQKIAIFRALQLGDLLCCIPAVKALKLFFPEAEITLIGLPWAKKFVDLFSAYFHDFISFPGYPGIVEQPFNKDQYFNFVTDANNRNFDLIIQMHGNGSIINPMIAMLGAKRTAGYCEEGRYKPDGEFFMVYPEGLPEPDRHLKLMEFLGVKTDGNHLEFPISDHGKNEFKKLVLQNPVLEKNYVCIHAGARDTRRWWPAENFAECANRLGDLGFHVVLTGTEAEKDMVEKVACMISVPFTNVAGKTDIETLACLLKNSAMLLSNDTGVSHMAAAIQVSSVIIFLASDPARWAPLNNKLHKVILPQKADDINYTLNTIETLLRNSGLLKPVALA